MKRIRLNRGGLYPTDQPKQAGYKDFYYDHICDGCKKKILKKESQMAIPGKEGEKHYHLDDACLPKLRGKKK